MKLHFRLHQQNANHVLNSFLERYFVWSFLRPISSKTYLLLKACNYFLISREMRSLSATFGIQPFDFINDLLAQYFL